MSKLNPTLRNIEREIDKAYMSNPLIKEDFALAAWFLLAFAEDMMIKAMVKREADTIHKGAALIDNLIVHLRYPLYWLHQSCRKGEKVPFSYDANYYQSAWDLLDLGERYEPFVSAFTYASRNIISLELQENQLIPSQRFLADTRYEAYSRLIKPSSESLPDISPIYEEVAKSLKISGERFSYKSDHRLIAFVRSVLRPLFDKRFVLPPNWQFSRYSNQDFRSFYEVVASMAAMHWCAHCLAAVNGCIGLGFAYSILVVDQNTLLRRVVKSTDLSDATVSAIMQDMTYGSNNIRFPDPAIQPLIMLTDDQYAIMPSLWIGSAAERNFTVLLNKLPLERSAYAALVENKEDMLRQYMKSFWYDLPYRYYEGYIPGHAEKPDIDLAVISDVEKLCMLMELKWFISPADIGEVVEKSEELEKGVSQLQQLKQLFEQGFRPLLDALKIDSSYTICLVLASENWIGLVDVQSPDVAIIKAEHIARRIASCQELRPTIDWINGQQYLPSEGKEYQVIEDVATVTNWTLRWYGIKPLVKDEFFPL